MTLPLCPDCQQGQLHMADQLRQSCAQSNRRAVVSLQQQQQQQGDKGQTPALELCGARISAKLQRSQMALMRRGAPAPPPLRLGALLVLCSLSGLAVPVGSGSAAGELSAAAPLCGRAGDPKPELS